jgi:hypothetical protein
LLGFAVRPRTGTLVVTATGHGNAAVEIYVDGRKRCDGSQCALASLEPGRYRVTARAKGYQPIPDVEVAVTAGGESHCVLTLSRTGVTAIRVTGGHEGLTLSVDGKHIGLLPQTVSALAQGEHLIRVVGSDRYAALETRVMLDTGETAEIGPVKLKVLRGLANIVTVPEAEGAHVSIVGRGPERRVPSLPIRIDVPTDEHFTLVATKGRDERFEMPLSFEDGHAERTFTVFFVRPITELPKRTWCDCAPGNLKCAMECAARGNDDAQAPLDGASIRRVVSNFAPSVRRGCWEPAVHRRDAQAPSSARVAVKVTIARSGHVENASTSGDPKGYPGLARCIEEHVRGWKFPRSAGQTSANVPFVFSEP